MHDQNELVLPNLRLAREITEQFFNYKKPLLNKDAFYMFSISKFILLKEKIIKKDSVKSILYFDNEKNKEYSPAILYFYQEILKKGSFKRNNTSIVLKDNDSNLSDLEDAVWCLNKVRDSLAHGKYFIDLKKECISINNVAQDGSYSLIVDIPVELLNSFSLIMEKNSEEKSSDNFLLKDNDYSEFDYGKYINRMNKYIFNFYKYKDRLINNDIKNNYNNKIYTYNLNNYKEYNNDYILDNYKYNPSYLYTNRKNNKYINLEKGLYALINIDFDKLTVEELCRYGKYLLLYKPKDDEKLLYMSLLTQFHKLLVQYNDKDKNKEFNEKTKILIEEMKKIIGIKDTNANSNSIISLYNYMSIAFSQISDIDYSKIKTDSLYIDFTHNGKIEGTAVNYYNTIEAIKKKCDEFNIMMEHHIESYDKNQNQRYRHSIMDIFAKFYVDTMESMGRRNKFIVDSIRNSVEHANYRYFDKGYIVLYDQTDHNDLETIKFKAAARPRDMFELTKQIENNKNKDYLLSDFVKQLTGIIDNDTFIRTWNNMNKLSMIIFGKELDLEYSMENMYQEALLTVMKQAGLKQ